MLLPFWAKGFFAVGMVACLLTGQQCIIQRVPPTPAISLSLVFPCFNEEGNIERTVREARAWIAASHPGSEIIVVNDGSSDCTREILSQLERTLPELRVIHHETNSGYGAAILSGCDGAKKDDIAIMDSDGQFRIQDLALLIPERKNVEFVAGRRQRRADPSVRRITAFLYGWLVRRVLGVRVRDINCGMKLFKRSVWPLIRPKYASGALFYAEMFLHLSQKNIRWVQVPVPHYPRTSGTPTGVKPRVILRMFKELWKLKHQKKNERTRS